MPAVSQNVIRTELVDLQTGKSHALYEHGRGANHQGYAIVFDGLFIHSFYTDGSVQTWDKLAPNGSGFTLMDTANGLLPLAPSDICFDGRFFWVLDATNVTQYADARFAYPVKQWAHGVTTPRGITTDGNLIIILEG